MSRQIPANAQNMPDNHEHTPTHTLQTYATDSNLLHVQA